MRFHLVSLFPEFFVSPFAVGLLGRAMDKGIVSADFQNPRDYSENRRRNVDDYPYGGGPGMVMQAAPVLKALRAIPKPGRILLMSPSGRTLDGNLARALANEEDITIICGRYEGIDARMAVISGAEEISVGEAILNGGETAALAVIESVSRFLPDFLGTFASTKEESFSNGLLEYPQYTRPEMLANSKVPAVLLGGNHRDITRWRRNWAIEKTWRMRPWMLDKAVLDRHDAEAMAVMPRASIARNLSFCLIHHPVMLDEHKIGCSSLTNLDIHDIARISRSYGMGKFYVLMPLSNQLRILQEILEHWKQAGNTDRARALASVQPVGSFEEMLEKADEYWGAEPACIATSARWPKKFQSLIPADIRHMCSARPAVICLGTARGLAPQFIRQCAGQLRPLRFLSDNHLSVRSAAAIIADRILGDFY